MKSRRAAPLIGITPDVALRPAQGGSSTEAHSKSEQSRTTVPGDKAEPLIVLQERYARAI